MCAFIDVVTMAMHNEICLMTLYQNAQTNWMKHKPCLSTKNLWQGQKIQCFHIECLVRVSLSCWFL